MTLKRTAWLLPCLLIGLTPVFAAKKHKAPSLPPEHPGLTHEQWTVHLLNRLTWGLRSGDAAEVEKLGVAQWIDRQLHPQTIAENPVLVQKLALLDTLSMTPAELATRYPSPKAVKAMVAGSSPEEPSRRVAPAEKPEDFVARLEGMTETDQLKALNALPPAFLQRLYPFASPTLRRRIQLFSGPVQLVNQDLVQARLVRAVYSNRQLEDVLADFWYNHFNVFLDKGADRYLVTSYERDVIRPHVLGKFGDLLRATAQSPAMLFYLDNWQSIAADSRQHGRRSGLNENYGRELMELHTLGVDGGYTQADVTEVARCFTGWTIRDVRSGAEFFFNPRMHDNGEKHVLGVVIAPGGGMDDGLKVLDLLARHPSTARFVSRELAVRFVSDNPPSTLLDKMASTFLATDGDIRAVLQTMLDAPEFRDPANFRSRLKSPLEMMASALRATGADVDYSFSLAGALAQMGEPLYRKAEPTGYPNRGSEWMNSASLVARMNFANALARNRFPGVTVDASRLPGASDDIARMLLGTPASAATSSALLNDRPAGLDDAAFVPERDKFTKFQPGPAAPAAPPSAAQVTAGMLLGSPDFQRK